MRRVHQPPDWPYRAGEATEVGSTGRRFARTGTLFVEREPTKQQIKMLIVAHENGDVIPIECDRRVLKGLVARRFVAIQADETGRVLPRGKLWIRKHLKREEERKQQSVKRRRQHYKRTEPTNDDERELLERTRAEARDRVLRSGEVPTFIMPP